MRRFPFKHLSLDDVAQREALAARFKTGDIPWWSSEHIRFRELCDRTPSGCMNYPRAVRSEPEAAA